MFPTLQTEVEDRFNALQAFFATTRALRNADAEATIKGLMFVQVYAVYEYTVKAVVREAIDGLKTHNHKLNQLSPSLLALFLDPELTSLKDIGPKRVWEARLTIFARAFSKDSLTLSSDTIPPNDGSHFRYSQLEMMFKVFGIRRRPVQRQLHATRINEVVGHRNNIAHGEESAEDIGRRYTRSEISRMLNQMRSVCLLLISAVGSFCSDPKRHRRI